MQQMNATIGEFEFSLRVNGKQMSVSAGLHTPLLLVLRNHLGLKGAKYGCGQEQCGACKVLVDGQPTFSCSTPAREFVGTEITTVEGLSVGAEPHPVQAALAGNRAAQCGYCIPGIVVSAAALLAHEPCPSVAAVRTGLRDHLCRCGSQNAIVEAIAGLGK